MQRRFTRGSQQVRLTEKSLFLNFSGLADALQISGPNTCQVEQGHLKMRMI